MPDLRPRGTLLATLVVGGLLAVACGPRAQPQPLPDPTRVPVDPDGDEDGDGAEQPSVADIVAASDLPATMHEPLPGDGLGVTIHRLSNGLTVYISTDRKEPRFSAWIAVRAGSRHDPADSTGLAHYLEHMLFKGTDELGTLDYAAEKPHLERIAALYDQLRATDDDAERARILAAIDEATSASSKHAVPNELDNLYSTMGITGVNAFTSNDMTVYIADVPTNRLAQWARIEGERFRDPSFRLFYPELEAVYEEKNRSLDSAWGRVNEAMMKALFPRHPYGTQTTIGDVEHLKTPAYADMVAFFERWYVPNNVAIVLAGDIDPNTAVPVLEEHFGAWKPAPLEPVADAPLPPLDGRTQVDIEAEGENSVFLAWKTVGVNHPDQPALEVMDWLVSNQSTGILDVELVLSQKLPAASSGGDHMYEAGYWQLYGKARDGQTHAEVEELLLDVVAKLKSGAFTQEDIDAIVLQAEKREMSELESNRARVYKMIAAFLMHQTWEHASTRSERLRKVTTDDVLRVAETYLGGDYVAVYRKAGEHEPPKLAKPSITPIEIDPAKKSAFAGAVEAMPSRELDPEWLVEGDHYQRVKLPAGDLIAAENDVNELFQLTYVVDVGHRRARLACLAVDLLERSGTQTMSIVELERQLFRMGTSIDFGCSADQTWITVAGLDRNLEDSVALLEAWLAKPKLDRETLAKLVNNEISQRKDRVQEPRTVSWALSSYASRGAASDYLIAPSNRQLRRARVGRLARLVARLPNLAHETRYFGPRPASEVAEIVALGKNHADTPAIAPVGYRKVREAKIFFVDKEVAQAQIAITFARPPLPHEDRAVAELYGDYLGGGMSGLIFQEIREARGLAYSASARHRAGQRPEDQSALTGYVGTQTDKTIEALSTMLELMRAPPMHAERFAKAKQGLDQRYRASRVAPRSITGWVADWDDLGLTADPRPGYWATIQKLEQDDVAGFARRFADAPVIISIMGDAERIDLDALRQIGEVEVVDVDDLFSY